MDHKLDEFLAEHCVADGGSFVTTMVFRERYKAWCKERNCLPLGSKGLSQQIRARGHELIRPNALVRAYYGLRWIK